MRILFKDLLELEKPRYQTPGHINLVSHNSSLIQTVLSVSELHRFSRYILYRVADYTAGWDFHPTPKNLSFYESSI